MSDAPTYVRKLQGERDAALRHAADMRDQIEQMRFKSTAADMSELLALRHAALTMASTEPTGGDDDAEAWLDFAARIEERMRRTRDNIIEAWEPAPAAEITTKREEREP